jgi:hypothetical protein
VIPPLAIRYGPEGEEAAEVSRTAEVFVEVVSVLPGDEEAADIRDVKPLRRQPSRWLLWAGLATALFVIAALVYYWWWRRRRTGTGADGPVLAPHEEALRALERLRRRDLRDPEAVHACYFALSEVIRRYVEGRFGLNATDLTTEEIVARLGGVRGLGGDERDLLRGFLGATDRVKFAAHEPSEEEIRATYENALTFVEVTRERPIVAPPDAELKEAA